MSTRDRTERDPGDESEHVCAFCQTVFDVDETTSCPLCDAEIVVRRAE